MSTQSLQECFAPKNGCFGCGPANPQGLRLRSRVEAEEIVADWTPQPHHAAFPGVLNGGIIGALLDCHCNWTATIFLMKSSEAAHPPCTVTADYAIKLHRPTPMDSVLRLRARPLSIEGDRAVIEGTLEANGKVCASCRGTFVAVK